MTFAVQIDRVYSTAELADLCQVSVEHICYLARAGELRGAAKDERGRWRIPGAAMAGWVVDHTPCASAPAMWMTPMEAAQHCDITATALRERCREGRIPMMPNGTPGYARCGQGKWLVHGDALRRIVSFKGPSRARTFKGADDDGR